MEGNTPVAKYVWLLLGANLAFVILFGLVSFWLDLDPDSTPSLVLFFVSITVPAYVFVKDHGREPTKAERKRLVRWSFGAYLLFSVLMLALLLALPGPLFPTASGEEHDVQTLAMIIGISLGVAMLLAYAALAIGFSVFTKQIAKGFEQQALKDQSGAPGDDSV